MSTCRRIERFKIVIGFLLVFTQSYLTAGQDYEVADIDCAIGTGGKELLTARLRRPDGFRGMPIFADDRAMGTGPEVIGQELTLSNDSPCQIVTDPGDTTGRVFKLRVTDFSHCGVLKRNGFINVRVWFPQLPGVVMLSDQEVIIMCKPPAATVVQSKTAGFAGSIPSGARVSGIVEETPGRLEYEVALYRETASPSTTGRSSAGAGAYITGMDSHELPVDQAVPIGTRLQLRARINHESAWKHAKLMEVSVSPDPKNPNADGSVSLVREGCRNPELASIIPKQPYRYKERTNEVVLDFEAFLLSNMGDRNTLWLHTQIKACMESQDCHPDFCMDVYQPSGFGRRRRRNVGPATFMSSSSMTSRSNNGQSNSTSTGMEYSAPLSQHWRTIEQDIIIDNARPGEEYEVDRNGSSPVDVGSIELSRHHVYPIPIPPESIVSSVPGHSHTIHDSGSGTNVHKEEIGDAVHKYLTKQSSATSKTLGQGHTTEGSGSTLSTNKIEVTHSAGDKNNEEMAVKRKSKPASEASTKFGDNIGFSVIMPSDYYRTTEVLSTSYECKGWAMVTFMSLMGSLIAALVACIMSYKLKRSLNYKERSLYPLRPMGTGGGALSPPLVIRTSNDPSIGGKDLKVSPGGGGEKKHQQGFHHNLNHHKYARDPSIYRS